jgi:ABC-type polysaccharide/polyol phosphate export permease
VFFSSSRFPEAIQPAIQLLPLTAVNDALRGVMLEGVGLAGLGSELAILSGWIVLAFALALWLFRWR